jgi:crossover junction endodeoxyribonuclease RuvC
MKIVGIDPGVTGAIAYLDDDDVRVYDMPRDMDGIAGATVYRLLAKWEPDEVYIERTHAMPINGSKATYSLGDSNGSLRTAAHILRTPLIWVPSRQWQSQFSLYGGGWTDKERKNRSRWRAQELFPTLADQLMKIKDHNRAEALLIAEYGRRTSITKAVTSG